MPECLTARCCLGLALQSSHRQPIHVISCYLLHAAFIALTPHVVPHITEISLLLLPKEEYVELLHQRRELIRDVLQYFGARMQRVE